MRAVTIKDVAARAGVSAKTVSRVINGEAHVRPNIQEIVKRIVAELDYRPNAFARSLSSSRSYLLGLFLDDPGSGYAADIQLASLLRCRQRSYHLVVEPIDVTSAGWLEQVNDSIHALRLDGAILTPPLCDNPDLLAAFDAAGLPYVRISPSGRPERSSLVRMDDRAAAHEMTGYLIGLGHRDIGYIKGDPAHSASSQRFEGYLAAMAAAGLVPHAEHIREGDFSFRSGLAIADEMLGAAVLPTAIFAGNDDMALGVLVTAMKHGIAVPRQLSIAGFDDAPTARAAWPQLTTIRQPKAEMAAAAVDILVDPHYRGNITDPGYQRLLDYEFIERSSTAAVDKRP